MDEDYKKILLKEPETPIEKLVDKVKDIPLYMKFQDPEGKPAVEVGIKITF